MIQKRLSRRHPAKYVTDLDFADNIALLSGTMANAQTLLTAVEENAAAVGLHIIMKKTEYIRIGDFSGDTHPTLCGTPCMCIRSSEQIVEGVEVWVQP